MILEWFLCFKSAHFCEQRLRLVSALKHEKINKNEKSWNFSKRGPQCGQPFWSRCRPRKWSMGHVRQLSATVLLVTFPATLIAVWPRLLSRCGHVQRGRNMAHKMIEFAGHVTTWPMKYFLSCSGHVRGHIPVTFVVMFVATFKLDFWSFLTCFWEIFKTEQIRLVYAFGTTQKTSKNGF